MSLLPRLPLFLLACLLSSSSAAQTFTPSCGETFYDSGGPDGRYEPYENITYQICPDAPGEAVTVDFTFVDVERFLDELRVFQGGTASGNGTLITAPGTFTSTAPNGCLTVTWDSDDSGQRQGYAATVSCGPAPTPPENDDIADALFINAAPYTHTVTALEATLATAEPGSEPGSCGPTQQTWWYRFDASEPGDYTFIAETPDNALINSGTDVTLTLFNGGFNQIICQDDDNGNAGGEQLSFSSFGSTRYLRVAVAGTAGAADIQLRVFAPVQRWIGMSGSNWSTAANWTSNRVPGPGDIVEIGPTGIFDDPVLSQNTSIAELIIDGGSLTITQGATLTLEARDEAAVIIQDDGLLIVNGQLSAANIEQPGADVRSGTLIVGDNGQVDFTNTSFGLFLRDKAFVNGTLTVSSSTEDGILLQSGANLTIGTTGLIDIDGSRLDGLYVDDGTVGVSGQLTITDSGEDGIDTPDGLLTIATTGQVLVQSSAQIGFEDAAFDNTGTLVVTDSGNDGINTRLNVTNQENGSINVDGAGGEALDIEENTTVTNDGSITLSNGDEGAVVDGLLATTATGELFAEGVIETPSVTFAAGAVFSAGDLADCATFTNGIDLTNATLRVDVDGGPTACTGYDQSLTTTGGIDLTDAQLLLRGSYVPSIGDRFLLLSAGGATPVTGIFVGLPEGSTVVFNDVNLRLTYVGGDGNDVELIAEASLPVELIRFVGYAEAKHNVLTWTARSEEAFSHYIVERSADDTDTWQELGTVAGASVVVDNRSPDVSRAMSGEANYAFTDTAPLPFGYYRLRMIDQDGTFTIGELIHLGRSNAPANIVVYPNPSNGRFIVNLPLTDSETATITLHDLTGRQLFRGKVSGQRYEQRAELSAGIYLLSADLASGRVIRRVVVR